MPEILSPPLKGKKALVLGIANEHSIAYGCAACLPETRRRPGNHLPERQGEAARRAAGTASWRRPFSNRWMSSSRASWKPCSTASAGHGDGWTSRCMRSPLLPRKICRQGY